jgi:alpha-tubulin suppressor-like RCC1 family protein
VRGTQVSCGGMNSVVLTAGGEVWTWGEPWGDFAMELQRTPRKVRVLRVCERPKLLALLCAARLASGVAAIG